MARKVFLPKLQGLFAVLKPKGITSGELCNEIRAIFRSELGLSSQDAIKVGHGGALDRDATGIVAIGVGRGCNLLPGLLHGDKEYRFTGCLGVATDTYDASGSTVETMPYDFVTRPKLEGVLEMFLGVTMQKPPVYSALKFQGRRLSDLTREGQVIPEVKAREVKVHSLSCTGFDLPNFSLELSCGGGFYVRSLVHDLGKALGTCAHVVDLERTKHGPFLIGHALSKDQWHLNSIMLALQFTQEHFIDDIVSTIREVRKAKMSRKQSKNS